MNTVWVIMCTLSYSFASTQEAAYVSYNAAPTYVQSNGCMPPREYEAQEFTDLLVNPTYHRVSLVNEEQQLRAKGDGQEDLHDGLRPKGVSEDTSSYEQCTMGFVETSPHVFQFYRECK